MRFSKITLRFLNKKHAFFKNYSAFSEQETGGFQKLLCGF